MTNEVAEILPYLLGLAGFVLISLGVVRWFRLRRAAPSVKPDSLDVERLGAAMADVFGNADDPAHRRVADRIAAAYAKVKEGIPK